MNVALPFQQLKEFQKKKKKKGPFVFHGFEIIMLILSWSSHELCQMLWRLHSRGWHHSELVWERVS